MKHPRTMTILSIATVAALALCAIPAMAQGPGPHHGRHHGPGMGPDDGPGFGFGILGRLDLSDEQREAIHQILMSTRENRSPEAREELREARIELARVLWTADATEADVQAASARLASLEQTRNLERFRIGRQVLAQLTPEQQAQALQILSEIPEEPPMPRRRPGRGF